MDLLDRHSTDNEDLSATESEVHNPGASTPPSGDSNSSSPRITRAGWDAVMRSPLPRPDLISLHYQSPSRSHSVSSSYFQSDSYDNEDTDSSIGEESQDQERSAHDSSLQQQKTAKAISSKYRYGGLVSTTSKYLTMSSKMRMKSPKLAPGVLVWALLPSKYGMPWWPGMVVGSRLLKRVGKDICCFRIILIYPPPHLDMKRSFFVPEERLRILKTRQAFDAFMLSCLHKVVEDPGIVSNFIVPAHFERTWRLAREKLLDMETTTPKSLASRLNSLHLSLPSLRKVWSVEDARRREKLATLMEKAAGAFLYLSPCPTRPHHYSISRGQRSLCGSRLLGRVLKNIEDISVARSVF